MTVLTPSCDSRPKPWSISFAGLILAMVFLFPVRAQAHTVPAPLVIACDSNFMPYTMLNSEGQPAGMFIDLWRLWAKKSGVPIRFSFTDWNTSIQEVRTGRADIHSGLFENKTRSKFMTFSKPFYESSSSIFYAKTGPPIPSMDALNGKTMGVIAGSDAANLLHSDHPGIRVREYEEYPPMITDVLKGNLAAVADESLGFLTILGRLGHSGEFDLLVPPLYKKPMVAGVAKGRQDLVKLIEKGFNGISYQELAKIESQWIHTTGDLYFKPALVRMNLTDAEKRWLKKKHVIRVGVNAKAPPLEFINGNGVYSGIASNYLDLLGKHLGLELSIVAGKSWTQMVAMGDQGKIDLYPCVAITPKVESTMAFTEPYLQFPIVIITRSQSAHVGGLFDLHGHRVAVTRECAANPLLKNDLKEIDLTLVDNPLEGLKAVSSGKSCAFIGNLATITYLISKHGLLNLKVAASTAYDCRVAFAVTTRWPELKSLLNKGLATITPSEKNAISQRWQSLTFEHGINKAQFLKVLAQIGSISLLLLLAILFWNFQIKRREERFRGLIEHGMDITQAFTPNGTIVYQSPSHMALLGYRERELMGQKIDGLFHPGDLALWHQTMKRLLGSPSVISMVLRLRHKAGHHLFFEFNCINMTGKKALKAIVINARDVTGRINAEEELQQAHLDLEHRVQQRTLELTAMNAQLHQEIEDHMQAKQQILNYQNSLRSLASELVLTEERARRKIAVDLHDRVSQALALCKIKLGLTKKHVTNSLARELLDQALDLCRQSLEDSRTLTFEISPPTLYELGLEAALDELVETTRTEYAIQGFFVDDETEKPLAKDQQVTLYRACSELIMNVIKHARATRITVAIQLKGNLVQLEVEDNGVGFDADLLRANSPATKSFGLLSIRERIGCFNGTVTIQSGRESGTRVSLTIPKVNAPKAV